MSNEKCEPHGRRDVVFVQGGREFRRTWSTVEERAAIIMQMAAGGMSSKTIARAFGLTPQEILIELHKRNVGVFDLRGRQQDGIRKSMLPESVRLLPETVRLVKEFATQRGLFLNSAVHSLVLAGLKALSGKDTDNA